MKKTKYLVWQPDGYLEFIEVDPTTHKGGNGTAVLSTDREQRCATVVCDGNGLDVDLGDARKMRLTYAEVDYLALCWKALHLASGRKEPAAKFYQLAETEAGDE